MSSCNMERFVKKQLAKNPHWGTDTITHTIIDTLTVKQYQFDTTYILQLHDSTDTVVVNNDTVRIEITRWKDRLQVKTLVKERKVPYTKTVYVDRKVEVEGKRDMLQFWASWVLLCLILVLILKKCWS